MSHSEYLVQTKLSQAGLAWPSSLNVKLVPSLRFCRLKDALFRKLFVLVVLFLYIGCWLHILYHHFYHQRYHHQAEVNPHIIICCMSSSGWNVATTFIKMPPVEKDNSINCVHGYLSTHIPLWCLFCPVFSVFFSFFSFTASN